METYWKKPKNIGLKVQLPKSAKIFFQKSSKNDSSEGKSKIKNSLFSVIKSDKNKSIDKNSIKSKSQSKNSLNNESNVLSNDNEFINKISINEQSLNKVKKSSSFSSTNSLATSSTSSDNVTSTNKDNDCELLSEFNNAFKNNFLINQNLMSDYHNIKLDQNNKPIEINLNDQQQLFNQTNSPPKPPSRTKSNSKLNNKIQHDLDNNLNNLTKLNSHDGSHEGSVNYSKIEIANLPVLLNYSTQQTSGLISDENKLIKKNYSENVLNNLDNFQKNKTSNKVTISVNLNDKQINLEQNKLVNYKKDYQIENDMKNLIEQKNLVQEQNKNEKFNEAIISQQKLSTTNGLWSSNDNLQTINDKSKHMNLNNLNNNLKLFNDKLLQNESSLIKQQIIKKSNTTTNFDLKTTLNRSVIKDKFDKCLLDKTKLDSNQKERSLNDSIDKLVNKSISRLADKSLKNKQNNSNNDLTKNYLSNYQPLDSLLNVKKIKKSRIPLSKSSNALSYKPVINSNHLFKSNNSLNLKQNLLNDNCLDISSSSTCSLCTSLSTDSLESLNRKDSSRSSSLSNLNSSLDNCEFNKLKASNSTSKIGRSNFVRFIDQNRNPINNNVKYNYPFRLDGVRSLSNLTNYHLIGYTNRRLLKTNSNLFCPIRELSRIEESIDDDQDQKNLDQTKNDKLIDQTDQSFKIINTNAYSFNNCSNINNLLTNSNLNSNLNSTIDTNSLISSSLDCMDDSYDLTINKSSNLSNSSNTTNKISNKLNDSLNNSLNNSLSNNNKIKPSLNQFKSSLINQLIDSNTHLKNNICLINSSNSNTSINKLDEHDHDLNRSINLAISHSNQNIKQSKNDNKLKLDDEIDDLSDSNELNLIDNLNELQQNIFSNKKTLFAKNKSLLSKDSCRSFELNERIVDLEMQLTSHKEKFKESLNLIKLLSEHCNDLIDVFNDNYNCKLTELNKLINENQRLIKLNQQIKLENVNLNETCDDLKRHLNQEFHFNELDNQINQDNLFYKEQFKELAKYNKLKNALNYSRDNEQQLHDELNNLKIKFQQNNELYEKVKSKALEKVESANIMIENANKNNDRELILAKMQVKKAELKVEKLENELRNLQKENFELNQLLDNLK